MAYMLRRFGFYLVAFWVSITLNFFLPRFMPGDPVSRMVARLQGQLRPDQIEALRESFGLSDAPCGSSTCGTSASSSPAIWGSRSRGFRRRSSTSSRV